MSALTFKFMAKRQLKKLNKKIDRKILRGESYRKEARLHKMLSRQLRGLQRV